MSKRKTPITTHTWEIQTDSLGRLSSIQAVTADSFLIIEGSLHFYDAGGESVACFKHWNWFRAT